MSPRRKKRAHRTKPVTRVPDRRTFATFFFEDESAIQISTAVSLLATATYGIINVIVLGRSEREVAHEALIVALSSTLGFAVFYVFRRRPMIVDGPKTSGPRRIPVLLKRIGVFATLLLIALAVAPLGSLEPRVALWHITHSDYGLLPGVVDLPKHTPPRSRFLSAANLIDASLREKKAGNPAEIESAKDSMEALLQNTKLPHGVSQAAQSEVAYLQAYETFSRLASSSYVFRGPSVIGLGIDKTTINAPEHTPALFMLNQSTRAEFSNFTAKGLVEGKPVSQFMTTNYDITDLVYIHDVRVDNLIQDIGNLTWVNVTFVNSLVRYGGEPIRMGNVTFIDCTFVASPSGKGRELLNYLSAHPNQPLSYYVPSKPR